MSWLREILGRPLSLLCRRAPAARERLESESRLRESENRLSSILQSIGAGVVATDLQGRVAFLNPVAERLSGWDLVEALNRPVMEVLRLEDEHGGEAMPDPLRRVQEDGEIVDWSGDIVLRSRDDQCHPVACTVAPIASFAGITGAVFVLRDTRREREIQHNLLAAKEEAERASRAKSEFLAGMSHEIRTPLTSIIGMADLLEGTPLDEEQRRYVEASRSAGENLLELINGILDLSKIEAGRLEVEVVEFDLDRLLRRTCEIMALRARQKGLDFDSRLSWPTPCVVFGDPARIRQVLVNLIGNAVKFTERGEISVETARLPVERRDEIGRPVARFIFQVKDSGIGVADDKHSLIFEDYAQADSSMSRRYGGTGLGLAICRKLVGKMGGEISLESREGVGSTFKVELPLPLLEEKKIFGAERGEVEVEKRLGGAQAPLCILLAEDSPENRLLFKAYLSGSGHSLEMAKDGEEAMARFRQGEYDLVLMDIQMPGMDGYAATRAIRAWEREQGREATPVVALTAHAFQDDIEKSRESGCDGHLLKPIKMADFLSALRLYARPAAGGQGGSSLYQQVIGPGERLSGSLDPLQHRGREACANRNSEESGSKMPEAEGEIVRVEDFIADLVPDYLLKVRHDLQEMEDSLEGEDYPRVQLLGHTLKGSGGGYGFDRLTEFGARVEESARSKDRQGVAHGLEKLRKYLDEVRVVYGMESRSVDDDN